MRFYLHEYVQAIGPDASFTYKQHLHVYEYIHASNINTADNISPQNCSIDSSQAYAPNEVVFDPQSSAVSGSATNWYRPPQSQLHFCRYFLI